MSNITPSQTVGPHFKYGLTPGSDYQWNDAFGNDLVTPDVSGDRVRIVGQLFDGDGKVIPDPILAMVSADRRATLIAKPAGARTPRTVRYRTHHSHITISWLGIPRMPVKLPSFIALRSCP